ncbi:hypothetical protein DFH09DRAFT_1317592 [Mycena vulgaris]|nr:hypothetical protein DFH09DRAFT_1317592 [Mycena vulgaris]
MPSNATQHTAASRSSPSLPPLLLHIDDDTAAMSSTARLRPPTRFDDPSHHLAFVPPPPTPPARPFARPCPQADRQRRPEDRESPGAQTGGRRGLVMPFLPAALRPARNPLLAFFLLSRPAPPPARDGRRRLLRLALPRPLLLPLLSLLLFPFSPPPSCDLALVAWSVVMWSFLRLVLTRYAFPALATRWSITKEGKMYTLSTTRAFWFQTSYFWEDYPHTHLSGAMKRYYSSQIAYWLQQALVCVEIDVHAGSLAVVAVEIDAHPPSIGDFHFPS